MRVKTDLLSRVLFATDGSAYREMPEGVLAPKTVEELEEIVRWAAQGESSQVGVSQGESSQVGVAQGEVSLQGRSIIARGAGTSLAGQVVGDGVVVEMANFDKILEINSEERYAWVEPGVVLDLLNREAAKVGLFFGPETSTSNRCTIGGMVGNNSCGAHSLIYGSTRDHLLEAEVILADGKRVRFEPLAPKQLQEKLALDDLEGKIYRFLHKLEQDDHFREEVELNFPDKEVTRRNCGYALDLFLESNYNLCSILAGSEGTLALITKVKLNLVPLPPKERLLLCAHCEKLEQAFEANLIALKHSPAAVELMDCNILELSKGNITQRENRFFVKGEPAAILIIEFVAESRAELEVLAERAGGELLESGLVYHNSPVWGADGDRVWALRKAGLGLLTSMPGDVKPVSVVEDTAVAPEKLPAYLAQFEEMLNRYGLSAVYHAHIGTGELHLRPLLNLKKEHDVELFRELGRESALLVKKFGGSLSGEHGDGRLRGEFIPLMYGHYLYSVMKELKETFDPQGLFNRGKIIDTPPMNSSLRYTPGVETPHYDTIFDYSREGGLVRALEQCNGSADCLKGIEFGGVMCPSYRATGQERDSTRGRANVMRELLTNPGGGNVFSQEEILDVLELCLSCKGCKSECPSNVDLARYKAEYLHQHYSEGGVLAAPFKREVFSSLVISRMNQIQAVGSLFPAFYNWIVSSKWSGNFIKWMMRFAAERDLPTLSRHTLRSWARRSARAAGNSGRQVACSGAATAVRSGEAIAAAGSRGTLYLFADEFTNYNEAEVGIAFIELMTKLGYKVIIPKHRESGRAAFSKGRLGRGRALARKNVELLSPLINEETPLVGIEPSAILSFRDEYPDIVGDGLKEEAQQLAKNVLLYDEFIVREFEKGNISPELFTDKRSSILLHGHCHQKALASIDPSAKMLEIPKNYKVEKVESGCCGMAGSFGFERKHYKLSMEIGEQQLFPKIRRESEESFIAAPGFSCRQQIREGTGREVHHPVELLFSALK